MVSLDQHPTVLHHRAHPVDRAPATPDAGWPRTGTLVSLACRMNRGPIRSPAHPVEASLLGTLLRRKIRLRGDPRLLLAFGRCFPS
jgi:hypothetical protein